MAQEIITPYFRGAFLAVFKPSRMKDQPNSALKYSVRAAFPPNTDFTQMKKEAQGVLVNKFGPDQTKWPKSLRSPFRRNDELDTPIVGVDDDWIVMTFSAAEDKRPGVVDGNLQDIIDDSQVYSGAWYRARVRAFAYDTSGNKGVSFGLQHLQKYKDDEPLGGRMPASKAFEKIEGSVTAAGMFD